MIENAIQRSLVTEVDEGIEIGPSPETSYLAAAIITGIMIGAGVFLILFAMIGDLIIPLIISIIVGIITTIYFNILTPY